MAGNELNCLDQLPRCLLIEPWSNDTFTISKVKAFKYIELISQRTATNTAN